MNPSDLCYITANEALTRFRNGTLSPVELLQAQLDQLNTVNPAINAIRSVRAEQAMQSARESEQRYASKPETVRPLEGIPTLLKNEHELIGEETDCGSLLLAGEVDKSNSPITQRLLDAGAVIHARTHVPEFYLATFTRSVAHGTTHNPWNHAITCGGSSGGSGAALAAGMGCLSSASDIGGSIRIPSSYCGVVGLKPSYGRVPEEEFTFATNTFNHNGLMCRSVEDARLMFNVINGPHRCDPSTIRPKLEIPPLSKDVRGLRIALSIDLGYYDIAPDIEKNTLHAAQLLRDQGAIVEEVQLGWDMRLAKVYTDICLFSLGTDLYEMIKDVPPEQVSDYVRDMAQRGLSVTSKDYLQSWKVMGELHEALQQVYDHYDVLLCPTVARNDLPAEGKPNIHDDLMKNGLTYPFNVFSRHPVLAVPSGIASNHVPTGVQIVGRSFCEETVLRVGAALEKGVGWLAWRPNQYAVATA